MHALFELANLDQDNQDKTKYAKKLKKYLEIKKLLFSLRRQQNINSKVIIELEDKLEKLEKILYNNI